MPETRSFELWLEWEQYDPAVEEEPDGFANVQVQLSDGRRYALNVWTFGFLQPARYPWPYEEGTGTPDEYLLPPDLFVERLDRATMERVVRSMLAKGEMRPEWLCPTEEAET